MSRSWPRFLKYKLFAHERDLAPDASFKNMEDRETFRTLYRAKLNGLGIRVKIMLDDHLARATGEFNGIALLCFEDLRKPDLWCHRTMLAEWLEEEYFPSIPELAEEGQAIRASTKATKPQAPNRQTIFSFGSSRSRQD